MENLMDAYETAQWRLKNSYWHVQSNNGTTVVATNSKTGEVYNGPMAGYQAIFSKPADMSGGSTIVATAAAEIGGMGLVVNQQHAISVLPIVSVPAIVACSSTFTAGGVFTLATALPTGITKVWMYFNAVGVAGSVGGPAATGWYYCVMSSTTVGQAYVGMVGQTGEWLGRIPAVLPATLTTTAGANTPTINTTISAQRIKVPARTLGPNGVLRTTDMLLVSSSANNKVSAIRLAAIPIVGNNAGAVITASNQVRRQGWVYAAGATNKQYIQPNSYFGAVSAATSIATIDMTVDQLLDVTLGITNAADWCGVQSIIVEVLPS